MAKPTLPLLFFIYIHIHTHAPFFLFFKLKLEYTDFFLILTFILLFLTTLQWVVRARMKQAKSVSSKYL